MNSKPIIPWLGGKRRLAKHILPLFPEHRCYVEAFAGGAALFFLKEPSDVEVLNDVNGDLVNMYRVVKHHPEELFRQFKWALHSRQMYEWTQATPPQTLTDVQRAARFFYLQKLSFGSKIEGQSFGTATTAPGRLNLLRLEEDLSMAHLRLSRVIIEQLPWQGCVARYDRPHTLFHLDPPYWGTEGYGVAFGMEQYEEMAALMRSIAGRAIVSVNDVREMRKVFAGLPMTRLQTTYTVGGDRHRKSAAELVIQSRNK